MKEPSILAENDTAVAPRSGTDTLVSRVIAAIIDLIRSGDLRPGDPLPAENALATRFGVSRIVVREANRSLAALGIVDLANGRSSRVSTPDEHVVGLLLDHVVHTKHVTVQQVLDVRRSLEVRAAVLAAVRRSDEEADAIVAHAAGMRAAFGDSDLMREHDIAMHAGIAAASQNPLFAIMIKAFAPVIRQTWPVGWKSRSEQEEREQMVAQHEAIAAAIKDQDVGAARATMTAHFDDTVRVLIGAGIT
jgi:GntR family transcriptional repressor for pyruvate dehydrogenase complex